MANPKKTRYGMPSNWSTVYNTAPGGIAQMQITQARAGALPRGKQYRPEKNGFVWERMNHYSLTHAGRTARLVYNFTLGGWNCTCAELGLLRFFDRHTPAAEIRTTLEAVLAGGAQ